METFMEMIRIDNLDSKIGIKMHFNYALMVMHIEKDNLRT